MAEDTDPPRYASAPCFAHELADGAQGFVTVDPQQARDVARWRKAERERLIAARLAVPADERAQVADQVGRALDRIVPHGPGTVVSLFWPFRGELDLRDWMAQAVGRGTRIALPVVVGRDRPLIFRAWQPGCAMQRGVWNIPQPADGENLIPDIVIAPLVGYDARSYRLGYGGGFFDRTLAAMQDRPTVIGVGHETAAIPTIFPQPHDIPMDVILTGADGGQAGEP